MTADKLITPTKGVIIDGLAEFRCDTRWGQRITAVKSFDKVDVEGGGGTSGCKDRSNDVFDVCPYLLDWLYLRCVGGSIDELPSQLIEHVLDFCCLEFLVFGQFHTEGIIQLLHRGRG